MTRIATAQLLHDNFPSAAQHAIFTRGSRGLLSLSDSTLTSCDMAPQTTIVTPWRRGSPTPPTRAFRASARYGRRRRTGFAPARPWPSRRARKAASPHLKSSGSKLVVLAPPRGIAGRQPRASTPYRAPEDRRRLAGSRCGCGSSRRCRARSRCRRAERMVGAIMEDRRMPSRQSSSAPVARVLLAQHIVQHEAKAPTMKPLPSPLEMPTARRCPRHR